MHSGKWFARVLFPTILSLFAFVVVACGGGAGNTLVSMRQQPLKLLPTNKY
jgi:hypothetical protein